MAPTNPKNNQLSENNDKANCDILIWLTHKEDGEFVTSMTFFNTVYDNKIKPNENGLGFKYNILTFFTPVDADKNGSFTAILGDPEGYATKMSALGYNGIMCKQALKVKKELRYMLAMVLSKLGFSTPQIKKTIKEMVN